MALGLWLAGAVAPAAPALAGARSARPGPELALPSRVGPVRYRPPVDAPVADPFRPPPEPWLSGNRGIEYATGAGQLVGAIGPGVVTFAGPVAGRLVVTVAHPDGLRSSYVGLLAVSVTVDQRVRASDVVGVAATTLHLGVRRGDSYLDPAALWGRPVGPSHAILVPDRDPQPSTGAGGSASWAAALRHLGRVWP